MQIPMNGGTNWALPLITTPVSGDVHMTLNCKAHKMSAHPNGVQRFGVNGINAHHIPGQILQPQPTSLDMSLPTPQKKRQSLWGRAL